MSKTKLEIVKRLGCNELIVLDTMEWNTYADYTSVDIAAHVMEITEGKGVKCIIDSVGLSTYEISLSSIGAWGILISFGNALGPAQAFPLLHLVAKSAFEAPEECKLQCQDVFGWVQQGKS